MNLVIDIETDGLVITDNINFVGIHDIDTGEYWIYQLPLDKRDCIRHLNRIKNETLIYHNGKFDTVRILYQLGIDLPIVHDTQVYAYLNSKVPQLVTLDGKRIKGWTSLKQTAMRLLGVDDWDVGLAGKTSKEKVDVEEYLKKDLLYTGELFKYYQKNFPRQRIKTYNLVIAALNAYKHIEANGMPIDLKRLREVKMEYAQELEDVKKQLASIADINYNSPTQLSKLLFEDYGLPVIALTKTKQPSTAVATLKELSGKHPVVDLILKMRNVEKAHTFLCDWEERAIGGRLHATFNLDVVVTGRTSCKEPNLQQIPRNKKLKSLFRSTEDDWELVQGDFSQAELRFAGIVSDCISIKRSYRNNEDLHTNMAAIITEKPKDKITKEERTSAKAANFGYLYGMIAKTFVGYAKVGYGVDLSLEEATRIRNAFFEANYELLSYYREVEAELLSEGKVVSMMSREYDVGFEDLVWPRQRSEYVRKAINFKVQSAASDYVLCGLIQLDRTLPKDEVRFVATVHDSVLFLVKKNENFEKNIRQIQQIMQQPKGAKYLLDPRYPIDIPIVVDIEVGPWGLGVDLDTYMKGKQE